MTDANDRAEAPAEGGIDMAPKNRRAWSGWIAALLVLALVGWMGSGMLAEEDTVVALPPRATEPEPVSVEARPSRAQRVMRFLTSEGEVRPERQTPVRADAAGVVEELPLKKGAQVEAGDIIARAEREAQLAQARAELRRAERDFEANEDLAERGFATAARLEETRADLAAAQARLTQAEQAVQDTVCARRPRAF